MEIASFRQRNSEFQGLSTRSDIRQCFNMTKDSAKTFLYLSQEEIKDLRETFIHLRVNRSPFRTFFLNHNN